MGLGLRLGLRLGWLGLGSGSVLGSVVSARVEVRVGVRVRERLVPLPGGHERPEERVIVSGLRARCEAAGARIEQTKGALPRLRVPGSGWGWGWGWG